MFHFCAFCFGHHDMPNCSPESMVIEPYASLADQNAESVPTYSDLMVFVKDPRDRIVVLGMMATPDAST
jgi:hypothetical protein